MGREKQTHFITYSEQSEFPNWLVVKNLPANARHLRDVSFIPGLGKIPWGRAQQPTPVFLLDRGAWRVIVLRVAESDAVEVT